LLPVFKFSKYEIPAVFSVHHLRHSLQKLA
jgi:hypothetical protein